MSDLSALSSDYEATLQFAETVNTAVLSLKKSLRGAPEQNQTEALAAIVAAVRAQLTSSLFHAPYHRKWSNVSRPSIRAISTI